MHEYFSDFFDSPSSAPVDEENIKSDEKPSEQLPEGFFDDPKADAKVGCSLSKLLNGGLWYITFH